jgi:hypothetical protein
MLWERVSGPSGFGGEDDANLVTVNKKLLVKEVFVDEASGDEM